VHNIAPLDALPHLRPTSFQLWVMYLRMGDQPMQTQFRWEQLPRWKKALSLSLATLGMIAFLWHAHLWFDYGARMPRAPQHETGRIYPFQIKCITLYATHAELARFRASEALLYGSWLVTFLMAVLWQKAWAPLTAHEGTDGKVVFR